MCRNLGSLFLAVVALLGILLSFPITYLFFGLLGYRFMGVLNFLVAFLMLGVGCDDVFVFHASWCARQKDGCGTTWAKLGAAWVDASSAIVVTSLTTASAFLCNLMSYIPALQEFGLFMAISVAVNLIISVSLFPAAIAFQQDWLSRVDTGQYHQAALDGDEEDLEPEVDRPQPYGDGHRGPARAEEDANAEAGRQDFWEDVWGSRYPLFLQRHLQKSLFGFAMIGLVLGLVFATQLEFNDEAPSLLAEDSNIQTFMKYNGRGFQHQFGLASVGIVAGVKGLDRSTRDPNRVDSLGTVVWDRNFDLDAKNSSDHLVKWSRELWRRHKALHLAFPNHDVFHGQKIQWQQGCPGGFTEAITEMQAILPSMPRKLGDAVLVSAVKPSPIYGGFHGTAKQGALRAKLKRQLDDYLLCHNETNISPCISLYIARTLKPPDSFFTLGELDPVGPSSRIAGWGLMAMTTIASAATSGRELVPIKNAWETFVTDMNADDPTGGKLQVQLRGEVFNRIDMDAALFRSATTTPLVSASLVFGFVLLCTRSPCLSIAILLTITMCTAMAFFFFAARGWGLGVVEGLCATVLVGLNVDYTLHIALYYISSPASSRLGKVSFALGRIAPTVCCAASTTAAASVLLLPCQIVLFRRFGFVMAANTLVGAALSLSLFPMLLLAMGEEEAAVGPDAAADDHGMELEVLHQPVRREVLTSDEEELAGL